MSAPSDELVVIGKIVSVHGVRGDVKVYSFTDQSTTCWTIVAGR